MRWRNWATGAQPSESLAEAHNNLATLLVSQNEPARAAYARTGIAEQIWPLREAIRQVIIRQGWN
jgi:hypothetical protein